MALFLLETSEDLRSYYEELALEAMESESDDEPPW
jgi:hypothetical protein